MMVLKDILVTNSIYIILYNLIITYFLRVFLIKKKYLIDQIDKPQSVSKKKNIVLIGGIILIINLIFQDFILVNQYQFNGLIYFIMIFLIGIMSDLNPKFKAKNKFIVIFITSLIFLIFNKEFIINKISVHIFDEIIFNFLFLKIFFSCFCLTLYISGNNMIDGINGNSICHNILALLSLVYIMHEQNIDTLDILYNLYFIIFILLILLVFNFLNILFLGDNGSYLIAAIVALYTIYIIQYLNLNPFLASIILLYPCFEVLFSLISKKKKFLANKDHFHLKLHEKFNEKYKFIPLLIILSINSCFIFLTILNYQNDDYLKIIQLIYLLSLIVIYNVTFKKKN